VRKIHSSRRFVDDGRSLRNPHKYIRRN